MIQKYTADGLVWIDLLCPTEEEIRRVTNEYKINASVSRELTTPTLRPKVDLYENFIYLILHFPSIQKNGDGVSDQEVDFIIGKDFIITARYGEVDAFLAFGKAFEVEAVLEKGSIGSHAGFIFYAMLGRIYQSLLHRLEGIKDEAADIESKIFKGKEKEMVIKISNLSRYVLDLKRATSLHGEILNSFETAAIKLFGDSFKIQVQKIQSEYFKVEHSIKNMFEFISELRETNNSLLTTKQNEIVQRLTVIAFMALPLTIITALFQMDTKAKPIIGTDYDFWIIIGIEIIVALLMYIFFKIKKWL